MKPKINQLINKSVVRLKRGSPTVLTCLGVAGVVATTVMMYILADRIYVDVIHWTLMSIIRTKIICFMMNIQEDILKVLSAEYYRLNIILTEIL